MPIESHIAENEISIKDLSLEQPRKESVLEFDAKRDVTKEDWHNMKEMLTNCKQVGRTLEYVKTAAGMLILFPERKDEFLDYSAETWQHIVNFLEVNFRSPQNISQKTEYLALVRQMYPEKFKQMPPNFAMNLAYAPSIPISLVEQLDKKDISSALEFAGDSKIAFPDIDMAKYFSDEHIRQSVEAIENFKKMTKKSGIGVKPSWDYITSQIVKFKMLFPNKASEAEITKDDWKEIKGRLNSHRKSGNGDFFASLAANLKMATADKIIPTDDGLVVIDHKESDLQIASAPLPEIKKF